MLCRLLTSLLPFETQLFLRRHQDNNRASRLPKSGSLPLWSFYVWIRSRKVATTSFWSTQRHSQPSALERRESAVKTGQLHSKGGLLQSWSRYYRLSRPPGQHNIVGESLLMPNISIRGKLYKSTWPWVKGNRVSHVNNQLGYHPITMAATQTTAFIKATRKRKAVLTRHPWD